MTKLSFKVELSLSRRKEEAIKSWEEEPIEHGHWQFMSIHWW